jgi:hypothetical protein
MQNIFRFFACLADGIKWQVVCCCWILENVEIGLQASNRIQLTQPLLHFYL